MRLLRLAVVVAWIAFLAVGFIQSQQQEIALVPVNLPRLKQEIVQKRGKVVLVDFWASFCLPCRKAFPHFITMHKKYADKGLVVISVTVDNPQEPEQLEAAQNFLRHVQSPFLNLHLQESPEVWTKTLDFVSLPCYYIFDRQGKWVRFGGDSAKSINYDEVEKTIVAMLGER